MDGGGKWEGESKEIRKARTISSSFKDGKEVMISL